jgi:uncharacterized protein YfiM (DUF2279 family)
MKIHLFLILFSILMSFQSFGQFSEAPKKEISIRMNEYDVIGHDTINLDGSPFHQITFEKKIDFINTKTTKEEYFLAANLAVDAAVGFKFMYSTWDKEQHFLVGYGIANFSNGVFQLLLPKDMKHRVLVSTLLGFGMSVLAGAGKEYYDSRHPQNHTADVNDFLATAAGGAIGTLTLKFDLRKALYGKY